jgi:hypothetical protein
MSEQFDELYATNDYLMGELILARQTNEKLSEINRRLEVLLIKSIEEIKQCRGYLVDMQQQVGELATVALARVKKL